MNESNKWDYVRIKDVCSMQSGTNITSLDISETGSYPVYGGNGMRGYYEKFNTQNEVIIVGRQGALAGNVHITNKKIWATDHAVVTKAHFDYDTKFLYYALYAMNLNQYANDTAAQPGLTVSKIQRLFIIDPPFAEQKQIVSYLDAKTSEIDSKIAVLTKKKEAYLKLKTAIINRAVTQGLNPDVKLKPSGIDWLGDVPEHWKITRFKDVSKTYTGNSIKDEDKINYDNPKDAKPYISTKDIDVDYFSINYDNGMYVQNDDTNFRIAKTNSTLLCIEGGSAGRKKAFVSQDISFVNKLCCYSPFNNINGKYLFYYVNSDFFSQLFSSELKGMIGGVTLPILKCFAITVPPLYEQKEIADYLDKKCSSIDKTTTIIGKQIETYKHLRRSLINEVITGQRTIQ